MRLPAASRYRVLCLVAFAFAALLISGCGYRIGNSYSADIRTVYVPIFTCEDYRRQNEFLITEAVQKQIQQRTPFRLAKNDMADTKLTGKITAINKNVLALDQYDDARELQVQFAVNVTWEDLRTGRILAQQNVAIPPEVTQVLGTGDFAPEVGQSLATATQVAVDKVARQIVDMMQTPW